MTDVKNRMKLDEFIKKVNKWKEWSPAREINKKRMEKGNGI